MGRCEHRLGRKPNRAANSIPICQYDRGLARKGGTIQGIVGVAAFEIVYCAGRRAPADRGNGARKGVVRLSISMGSTGTGGKHRHDEELEAPLIPSGRLIPFLVVTALFFLWAIPNNLNDILIRQFMKSFEINRSGAAGIQIWFYLGYFLLAVPAGQLMHRFGYKLGIITGLVLLGTGCLLFYPAAQMGLYWFFLVAQFVIASGLSFLETASNPFIAQLGPTASSERRLNFS